MKTILIVDSDSEFRKQVKELINPDKVRIQTTTNGSEVVLSAGEMQPDAIILNLELKDMNGFLVCSSLKKSPLTKDIPVLITSATKGEDDFEQHRKLKFRADGYYRKPLSKEDMSAILLETLGASALRSDVEHPLASDFTEENIDKLLDSTFLDASEDSEQSAAQSAEDQEIALEEPEDEVEVDLEIEDEEPVKGQPISDNLALKVEDISDDFEEVDVEEPVSAAADVHTVSDNAELLEPLKQEIREKSAQIISLEKENEFLTGENRNLLMSITTLKADIEEKVEAGKEHTEQLTQQISRLEQQLAESRESHQQVTQQVEDLKRELNDVTSQVQERDRTISELHSSVASEQAKTAAIITERDDLQQQMGTQKSEFDEKENMLMTTIENLTKNSRELEDQIKAHKERIRKLSGTLKEAISPPRLRWS